MTTIERLFIGVGSCIGFLLIVLAFLISNGILFPLGLFLFLVSFAYLLPPLQVVPVPDNQVWIVKTRMGRFVRVILPGLNVIAGWEKIDGQLNTLMFGEGKIIYGVNSADSILHTIPFDVGAQLDIENASPSHLHSLVEILSPAGVRGVTVNKVEEAIREVCGGYNAVSLNDGENLSLLKQEIKQVSAEKLQFFGISLYNVALGSIQPPAKLQRAFTEAVETRTQTETKIHQLRAIHDVISQMSEKEQEVLLALERLNAFANNPNASYHHVEQTGTPNGAASPIIIPVRDQSADNRRELSV